MEKQSQASVPTVAVGLPGAVYGSGLADLASAVEEGPSIHRGDIVVSLPEVRTGMESDHAQQGRGGTTSISQFCSCDRLASPWLKCKALHLAIRMDTNCFKTNLQDFALLSKM